MQTQDSRLKTELLKLIVARAVEIRETPFTLASGNASNLYVDLRRITQDPLGINLIGKLMLNAIYEFAPESEFVGGLETGSIPISTAVSLLSLDHKKLGAFWVRKKMKDHGLQNLIEGNLRKGARAVIVDDTITTGGSSLQAIDAVRAFGVNVSCAVGVVDRGASNNFEKAGIPYHYFFTEKELQK
ncbi:MAG: orotate phosphoribosyltransferase [Nitrososphaerales archaeon]